MSWSNNFRGSITIVTETGQITQSHLVIRNARKSDEGNYTCKPSIFKLAKLRLFVLNGKSCQDLISSKESIWRKNSISPVALQSLISILSTNFYFAIH